MILCVDTQNWGRNPGSLLCLRKRVTGGKFIISTHVCNIHYPKTSMPYPKRLPDVLIIVSRFLVVNNELKFDRSYWSDPHFTLIAGMTMSQDWAWGHGTNTPSNQLN